jgi:diaminohydroxyphosphoribosylaminopyrimidine deaminase/5-amino-6-(5-phosphoribosylamino)uracil reductase
MNAAFMTRALELAGRGLYTTDPNPRVGCVLVKDGRIVGEGWHERAGEAHAEVHALRAAGPAARGAVAFVTLEPCCHLGRTPPCADALIEAGVTQVVCAVADPNPRVAGGGLTRLRAAGIAVECGLMAAEARAQNPGFFSRFERGRPFIRLKLAMSLDARTAPAAVGPAAGAAAAAGPHWITDAASRADVQALRAQSSAVLTGAGTVRADDPRLNVRLDYGPWVRQPLRILLDTDLRCRADARMLKDAGAMVFAALDAPQPQAAGRSDVTRVRIERVARGPRGLDLEAVVRRLAQLDVNELLVECGPGLAAGFLEAGLVDELILYVAPHFLGRDAQPLTALAALGRVAGAGVADTGAAGRLPRFAFRDVKLLDNDLRLTLAPTRQ